MGVVVFILPEIQHTRASLINTMGTHLGRLIPIPGDREEAAPSTQEDGFWSRVVEVVIALSGSPLYADYNYLLKKTNVLYESRVVTSDDLI